MSSKQAATLVLFVLWTTADARDVLCVHMESCLLPCLFTKGADLVIQWTKDPSKDIRVHSFFYNQSQFNYSGRATLSKVEIDRGNASLLLTEVKPNDEGTYKCYISPQGRQETYYVHLRVHAPVSHVSLDEDGERLKCESKGVFPEPSVSWSPQSDHSTSVTTSGTGLFSVNSSVPLTQRRLEEYSCNVSTEHSWRSATYRRTEEVTWSGSRTELHCLDTKHSVQSLVWTFNRTQVILEKSESKTVYHLNWERRVEQGPGSELILKDLSLEQQGLFSCSLTTDRATYLTVTEVTVSAAGTAAADHTPEILGGVFGTLAVVILLLVIGGVLYRRRRQRCPRNNGVV